MEAGKTSCVCSLPKVVSQRPAFLADGIARKSQQTKHGPSLHSAACYFSDNNGRTALDTVNISLQVRL